VTTSLDLMLGKIDPFQVLPVFSSPNVVKLIYHCKAQFHLPNHASDSYFYCEIIHQFVNKMHLFDN